MKRLCQWCSGTRSPAEFVAKAHSVQVEDDEGEWYEWVPPAKLYLCRFHVRFARRYHEFRIYRFRRLM